MFWIGFIKETFVPDEPGERGAFGLLRLGSWEERFVAHFDEWSKPTYSQQWRRALDRVLEAKSSALVTDMWLPTHSSCLTWWPMWRFEDTIIFQNHLFFFEQHGVHDPGIEIEDLYRLVGPRQTHDPEGTPVSEWTVPVSAVLKFLDKKTRMM